MSWLVAALVLNHLLLAADSSILILVFNFRFNLQVKPSGLTPMTLDLSTAILVLCPSCAAASHQVT